MLDQGVARGGAVVDHQHAHLVQHRHRRRRRHARRAPATAQRHREAEAAAHAGRAGRRSISPPIISTSCCEIARPRPVPPYLRVIEPSAWLKDWNRRASCSSSMPMPVSLTRKAQRERRRRRARAASTATTISPRSVNLTALPVRLIRTWPRRSGSPTRRGRHAAADPEHQFDPARVGLDARSGSTSARACRSGRSRHRFERQLAGLDLGKVEDVVDDAQQVLAGALDLAQVVALLRRWARSSGPAGSCR